MGRNVVMVATGSEKPRPGVRTLRHRQAKKFMIEPLGDGKVTHVQVNMAEVRLLLRWRHRLALSSGKQVLKVQRFGRHRDLTIAPDPPRARTVYVKLHSI